MCFYLRLDNASYFSFGAWLDITSGFRTRPQVNLCGILFRNETFVLKKENDPDCEHL